MNVLNIRVPSLRERPEEIPILVDHFLTTYCRKHGGGPRRLSRATLERLQRYRWPGNVRELENVIQRIVVLRTETVVTDLEESQHPTPIDADMPALPDVANGGASTDSLGLKELVRRAAEATEREVLKRTLRRLHWRRIAAARRLGISYKTLLEKIKHYRLDATDS